MGVSVDGVMFSLDPYHVFVEGEIMRNIYFWAHRFIYFCLNIIVLLKVDVICR